MESNAPPAPPPTVPPRKNVHPPFQGSGVGAPFSLGNVSLKKSRTFTRLPDGRLTVKEGDKIFIWIPDSAASFEPGRLDIVGEEYVFTVDLSKVSKQTIAKPLESSQEPVKTIDRTWTNGTPLSISENATETSSPFTICTWNVMADRWSPPANYPWLPAYATQWKFRSRLILDEIASITRPDLLCLQELGGGSCRDELFQELAKEKYGKMAGRHVPNACREGVAVCWRTDRFDLVRELPLNFSSLAKEKLSLISAAEKDGFYEAMERLSTALHHNTAAVVLLSDKKHSDEKKKLVAVASVHLYHMDAEVQLVEILLLLAQLRQLLEKHPSSSVFICGDFNCCPLMPSNRKTDLTALYQFLSEGSVSPQHEELQNLYKIKTNPKAVSPATHVKNDFKLRSIYNEQFPNHDYWTSAGRVLIDYIWFDPSRLKVRSLLSLLNSSHLTGPDLPQLNFGSDHVSLAAVVEYT